jgi:hypothetical protein
LLAHPPDQELHRLYIEAEDKFGLKSLGIIRIEVVSAVNRPPTCGEATAEPPEISLPNQELVRVNIAGVTDPDGDAVTITVVRVTQDEPLLGRGPDDDDVAAGRKSRRPDGRIAVAEDRGYLGDDPVVGDHDRGENQCVDAVIDPNGGVAVRAERSGTGNGRVYTIWFTASDGQGGSCDGSVLVCVPHDRQRPACVDDGNNFNSLGPCPEPGLDDRGGRYVLAEITATAGARTDNMATLGYSLPTPSAVLIAVYDVAGRRVLTLENAQQTAGIHLLRWDASSLANGMYFYRLRAGPVTVTKSVLILK